MKMLLKRLIPFILLSIYFSPGNSQDIVFSEYHIYECNDYKELAIPFYNTIETTGKTRKSEKNQYVFYSNSDRLTYWYKIIAKESHVLHFKINPTEIQDSFAIYVYNYNEKDFCKKVRERKLKPLEMAKESGKKDKKKNKLIKEISFNAEEGQIYYLCILKTYNAESNPNNPLQNGTTQNQKGAGEIANLFSISLSIDHKISDLTINEPIVKEKKDKKEEQKNNPKIDDKPNDIYAKKDALVPIKCLVMDLTKERVIEAELKITAELNGRSIAVRQKGKGEFLVEIEKDKNYKVECTSLGYKLFDHSVNISRSLKPGESLYVINMQSLKPGNNFIMKNIYFHPNTYALKKESESELNSLLNYLSENESVKIEIEGHTNGNHRIYRNRSNSFRGAAWNYKGSAKGLSKARAEAMKRHLVSKGIKTNRIITKGYGGDKMLVRNPRTLEEIQKNIRVEIAILED